MNSPVATERDRSPPRPKVVHVVVAGDIGGAERLLIDLASRPEQSCADHSIALMTPNPKLRKLLFDAGLKIHDRGPVRENPLAYIWRSLGPADVSWLVDVLSAERAGIVHVHTFGSHVIGVRAALRLRLPVVRTEHGIRHYLDVTCAPFRRWALERTGQVVAVSRFVADFVGRAAPYASHKLRVIRNGVDTVRFSPGAPPDSEPFTFVVASRLEPLKRVDLAIGAIAQVRHARLLIVGDGSARAALERLAHNLRLGDRVHFAGYHPDPRPIIAQAHAAINSCDSEGLGLSVLEAQAMAKPVIAIAAGGVPEVLQDGQTGWLVPEASVESLATSMNRAASDRGWCERLGANARRFVQQECRIESMCEAYAPLYDELFARPLSRPVAGPLLNTEPSRSIG
jgi:glycosyltransferase involved in cell wall biosynthesis